MSANYLHGVETIEVNDGPVPIQLVKTAVIGLVGVAPVFQTAGRSINEPILILNDRIGAQTFGAALPGYTIPQALRAIWDQQIDNTGCAAVIVVNVFDPARHVSHIDNDSQTFDASGSLTLRPGVANLTLGSPGGAAYAPDTDYALDAASGRVTRLATGAIAPLAAIAASYDYADPSLVTPADIIGSVDPVTGNRNGIQAFKDCMNDFGFSPKLLIAPGFSQLSSVARALDVSAQALRAMAYIDAPIGTTFQQAVEGRGPDGDIAFDTSSERAILCYPYVQVFDASQNASVLEPYSQRLAGLTAATDLAHGYWFSPSNKEIQGVTGLERRLTAGINDPSCDVNLLNEQGICTIFNAYGTGLRSWGNRSAAWPTESAPKNFIPIRRVADIIAESIERASLQFIDMPITQGLIDAITESVNGFLRTLIGRGALVDGRCWYDPANNLSTELALGHITFNYDIMPPPPAERISYDARVNINMLGELGIRSQQSQSGE